MPLVVAWRAWGGYRMLHLSTPEPWLDSSSPAGPFPGHVFQPLAIAHVLRERGHECAFYSGPRAARVVEGEDFPFFPSDKAEEDAMYDFMFAPEQTRTVNWRTMLQFSRTIQEVAAG